MREILFRGKRLDNGEWVCGNLFVPDRADAPTEICMGTNIVRITYDVDPATIGQYTGMSDKSGKRIFEGDIIKFIWNGEEHIDVVEFKPPIFSPSQSIRWSMWKDEIIGNCWDNPELLEEATLK